MDLFDIAAAADMKPSKPEIPAIGTANYKPTPLKAPAKPPPDRRAIVTDVIDDVSADFCFTEGDNHSLGSVFIYVTNAGPMVTTISYPGDNKFSDEGGKAIKDSLIYFIRNDTINVLKQFNFFMIDKSEGLTQAGMARLNQSIEAFVYCILGSQVNVRSFILGSSGSAKEAQREFRVLVEDVIRMTDIPKSVQRFQLAIDEAKVRLDLAISPGPECTFSSSTIPPIICEWTVAASQFLYPSEQSKPLALDQVKRINISKISHFFKYLFLKMEVSKQSDPSFEKKTPNALKADRMIHRVTFNPNRASPGEVLRVPVPKLDNGVVLAPGSLALIFNLTVAGHANNFLVNNVSRAVVDRLTLKFAGEIVQDTDGYDPFKLYEDLFLTENERASMLREGIQSADLSVVKGSDPKKLSYQLTDIQLEYEVIHSQKLADEAFSNYKNRKRFMYEHVTHLRTISIDRTSDTIINERINVPRRSMKGLFLFYETYTAETRDSERTFNPDITEVKLVVNGTPNKIYSQGMKTRDMWEEVFRGFGKENSAMNATDFYAGDRFGIFIDLRSMRDNDLRGSRLRLVNAKEGVQLAINRKGSGSGIVKCQIFILSDAQLNIINKELESGIMSFGSILRYCHN
ncbi:hypothetical protein AWC38_SpisGene1013 [Stylophora pistillata]|uniref:Uncharacterized protein n=1 Tax=Stylophora pistillata TaxID=50429 RepID=A0A2B4SW69_STYPI|nr:hypothetical protein AWC38_SpisGene1013 [Stylophora pistillata]